MSVRVRRCGNAALALVVVAAACTATRSASATTVPDNSTNTTTPIKHVVVIYDENVSFDHYFATYPYAANTDGPSFAAADATPSDVNTELQAGQTLSYTLTFDNAKGRASVAVDYTDYLAKVLDDASVTAQPVLASGTGLTVGSISGDKFTVTGTLTAGAAATVTYQVKVDSPDTGDHQLDNFVVPGDTPPPPTCEDSNQLCTTNPDPDLKVSKSVDPAPGSHIKPGDLLHYTLHFDNLGGKAAAPLKWTDDLTDVLDDATVVDSPKVATGTGVVVGPISGGIFAITGSLAAGTTATVTYSVRVNNPPTGNRKIDNYLETPGTTPPPNCPSDDPLCTHNEISTERPPAITGLLVNLDVVIPLGLGLLIVGILLTFAGRRRHNGSHRRA